MTEERDEPSSVAALQQRINEILTEEAEEGMQVPPDKAPLRAQGDLLATLARLRETYGEMWLSLDIADMPSLEVHAIIAKLIVTAVQQAEALPKPEGDLAAWREETGRLLDDYVGVVAYSLPRLRAHLAAMPAQPDLGCDEQGCLLGGIAHAHEKGEPFCAECAQSLTGQPDGDLAAWREEAIEYRDRLFTLAYGDGPEPEVSVERDDLEAIGDLLTRMIGHLAAMPAQRPSCANCGGRPAEHRSRLGEGAWCKCMEDCRCDGYVAEEGAAK